MFNWIKKYSHIFIHLSMISGVTLYVIFGAYIMQNLENKNAIEMNKQLRNKRNIKIRENSMNIIEKKVNNFDINYYKNVSGHELAKLDQSLHNCVIKAMESLYNFSRCHEKIINVAAITLFDYCYKNANLKIQNIINIVDKYGKPMYNELHGDNNKDIKNIHEQPASVFFKKQLRHGQFKSNKISNNNNNNEINDKISIMDWSFGSSIIFAFSVITTIGYGHVAPMTTSGRIFTIIYGLIGVPFTLLTIANVGLFLSYTFKKTAIKIVSWKKHHYNGFRNKMKVKQKIKKFRNMKMNNNYCCLRKNINEITDQKVQSVVWYSNDKNNDIKCNNSDVTFYDNNDKDNEIDESKYAGTIQFIMTLLLGISTFFYILFGAYVVHLYEIEMDFFQAFYFNFITLTTIGLGDFVPQSYNYLIITIVYVFFGMALVTVTLNLLSDILKKLHNFGRKIENVSEVVVWFGGSRMKMSKLMKYLIDTLNLPEETLETINIDTFIDNAIQKEEGKIESLRPKPFTLSDVADRYNRDIEAETFFMDATERSGYLNSNNILIRKLSKNFLEKMDHKIKPIPSLSDKNSSQNDLFNDLKINLDSLDTYKRWSSSDGITRKSSSEIFYLPTFETCSRSIDNSSFEDIILNENDNIIY
ncbi:Potassium channel subfamily K member 18 [Strongyloides ratti]|uniref:Potassium channel subfamily K member 18 n=1 Tax=Strongyloides ratti TaxID=34506 RepID=A0A090N0Z4_STRRB|nr:Potassium channel subfamily K member 18 [Strongyloides ratti]CEF71543.1 Potassium channel subfamily K member 18 [Strongyloides ratti]